MRKAWNSTLKQGKPMKRTAFKKVRKSTGERALFERLYNRCQGRSEVSRALLLPPTHERFHSQGSHLLPKGTHPELRLMPDNIVMITTEEHNAWHSTGDKRKLIESNIGWEPIVERYETLKRNLQ
jgi:hypothetical protein